jgi:hypothetical protein
LVTEPEKKNGAVCPPDPRVYRAGASGVQAPKREALRGPRARERALRK